MSQHLKNYDFKRTRQEDLNSWAHQLETCEPDELEYLLLEFQREYPVESKQLGQKLLTFERIVQLYPKKLARFISKLKPKEQLSVYYGIRSGEKESIDQYLNHNLLMELKEAEDLPSRELSKIAREKTLVYFRTLMRQGEL